MIYNDGVALDTNMRVVICPRCRNEEFSERVWHCRICGLHLYNECEGDHGFNGSGDQHNNPGNARFCEICGTKTRFFVEGLLKAWDDLPRDKDGNIITTPFAPPAQEIGIPFDSTDDDDELPF